MKLDELSCQFNTGLSLHKSKNTHNNWTEKEIRLLKRNYPIKGKAFLQSLFPRHSWGSIKLKASRVDIKKPKGNIWMQWKLPENVTEKFIIYLAGIVDGEGTPTISKQTYQKKTKTYVRLVPRIYVTNSAIFLLKMFQKTLQLGRVVPHSSQLGKAHRYYAEGIQILPLLKALKNYVILKKRQTEIVIKFCESRAKTMNNASYSAEEYAMYEEVHMLNTVRKGGVGGNL